MQGLERVKRRCVPGRRWMLAERRKRRRWAREGNGVPRRGKVADADRDGSGAVDDAVALAAHEEGAELPVQEVEVPPHAGTVDEERVAAVTAVAYYVGGS